LSGLAAIGILALTATSAQAAAGGNPFPITSFFVCQGINGGAAGVAVDVDASVLGTNPKNVTLGSAILACVVAKLFGAGTTNEINPNPGSSNKEGLKCYTYSASRQSRQATTPGIPDSYTVTDALIDPDPDVTVNQKLQYICAPANFVINP
jgi:hypothetical protein